MRNQALAPVAFVLFLGTAHAIDAPDMKPGLWKIHSIDTFNNAPPVEKTYKLCHDHAYDAQVKALGKKYESACTVSSDASAGGKRVISSTCKVSNITLTQRAVITLSENAYHSETDVTYSPALSGTTHSTTVRDETFQGPCPAGVMPGDRITDDGTIEHH